MRGSDFQELTCPILSKADKFKFFLHFSKRYPRNGSGGEIAMSKRRDHGQSIGFDILINDD